MNINAENVLSIFQGNKPRAVILSLALFVSIMGYVYVVDFVDPNKNFLQQISRSIFQKNYLFYSGAEGGIYIRIGQLLEQKTRQRLGTSFTNKPTSGAFENATSVASRSGACGLIQEDTLRKNDNFIKDLNYITPLYVERMHILYRDRGTPELDEGKAIISNNQEILRFFNGAIINTGHPRSGTRVFAGYLLSYLEEVEATKNNAEKDGEFSITSRSEGFQDALASLEDDKGEVEIIFNIVGAPLPKVTEILKRKKEVKLMGIDPIALQSINRKFDLNLRPMTFEGEYEQGAKIPTIGSYAYLVCSKDVPNSVILKLLAILDDHKNEISGRKSDGTYLLDEYDFLPAFEKKYNSYFLDFLRNLFLFIISVAVASASAMVFLAWVISASRQTQYFRKITDIYSRYLPENSKLDDKEPPFPRPIINTYQNEIVSKLVHGVSQLIVIAQDLRQDYKTGGLAINHYNHLIANVYQMKGIFQGNLFRRVHEVLETQISEETEQPIAAEELRHYHTAGYLTYDHYQKLVKVLKRK
ncbi:MAG: hypothetical protein GY835_11480 [bacterium]|nr:hypothetical protein [bacterium]